jgi:hypothetical protein
MKILILILTITLPFSLWAQTQKERIEDAYRINDERYELDCYYVKTKDFKLITATSETKRNFGKMTRAFIASTDKEQTSFDFSVALNSDNIPVYDIQFSNQVRFTGEIKTTKQREFYLPLKSLSGSALAFAQKFELNSVFCQVLFATEEKVVIDDERSLHLNVHPHDKYDYLKLTTSKVEELYNDPQYQTYVLLEEGNFKGNLVNLTSFLKMQEYFIVKNYFPESVNIPLYAELKVSPAGHNRYAFQASNKVSVLYTGGNHNYCMWNNTRRLLTAYIRSFAKEEIEIIYKTDAIVVQPKGLVGLDFNRPSLKDGNLLSTIFHNDPAQASVYMNKFLSYFTGYFLYEFTGMYRSITFKSESRYGQFSKTIKGDGKRDLTVTFKYQ